MFYSAQHRAGARPCCASIVGMCAGGAACPPSGTCADGSIVLPDPAAHAPQRRADDLRRPGRVPLRQRGRVSQRADGHAGARALDAEPRPALGIRHRLPRSRTTPRRGASRRSPASSPAATRRAWSGSAGPRRSSAPSRPRCARSTATPSCPTIRTTPATRSAATARSSAASSPARSATTASTPAPAPGSASSDGRIASPALPGQPPRCGSDLQTPYRPPGRSSTWATCSVPRLAALPGPGLGAGRVPRAALLRLVRAAHPASAAALAAADPRLPLRHGALLPARRPLRPRQRCAPAASCPPTVTAMNETNFGTVFAMFGNVWWMDDGVREIRKYLARASEPHCIVSDGRSLFDVTQAAAPVPGLPASPRACPSNTVIMHAVGQRLAPAELEARVHRERLSHAAHRVRPDARCRRSRAGTSPRR